MSDALDQAETALLAALNAIRAAKAVEAAPSRRLMPLKQAMHVLGLKDKQMRRWAQADEKEGISVFTHGRWLIDVDGAAAKRRRA